MDLDRLINYKPLKSFFVRRYSGYPVNRVENIAEHSFMVAINIIELCKLHNIPDYIRDRAVTLGVVHDISETVTADLPYWFKIDERNKELMDSFEKYELEETKKHFPILFDVFKEYVDSANPTNEDNDVALLVRTLVDLADAISVKQYAVLEQSLGNTSEEITNTYVKADDRIAKEWEKLNSILK